MLNLVLNILDVNKHEETRMVLDLQDISLFEISSKAINQVLFLTNQKGIAIKNRVSKNVTVKADADLLERVFVNLLTNAIKYSETKSDVLIEAESLTDQNVLRVKVIDSGIGIPNDKKHLVFQKFGQVQAKKSGGVGSTGIGLTFCKMAVEAHGGEIDFESEPDKGTIFWFTLEKSNSVVVTNDIITETNFVDDKVQLSEEESAYLEPFIQELREYKIYEISSISKIVERIEDKSDSITNWKKHLYRIIDRFDKEGYACLLK